MAENAKYRDDPKPECKYGTKCYQKNPDHLKKFKHPPKKMFSIFDVSSKNKRQKLDDSVKIESVKESASNSSFYDKITPKSVEIKESASNSHSDKTAPNSAEKKVENGSHEENSQLVGEELNKSSDCAVQNSKIKYHSLPEDIPNFIKELFLVEMPKDFYSFWEMYDSDHSIRSFMKSIDLKLVGPFDVLSKNLPVLNNQTHYILHWRFYFDPPEFQTIVASSKNGYHIGYYRDCPTELPCFVANNDGKNPKIIPMGENLFAALISHTKSIQSKSLNPFIPKKLYDIFIEKLTKWASDHNFDLDKKTNNMKNRQKKVVSSTFHNAGIVVPYNNKTQLGYRPLIESDAKIKKILESLAEGTTEESKKSDFALLQPIINMANIATDECDFGTGLELGIDLFCSGNPFLHNAAKRLLSVAYEMLDRNAFEIIIKAHLENRRKGFDLSATNLS